jgi:Na+-translocating ferredoxin:NAD+ oxidoreductase RNF subunit RnfB
MTTTILITVISLSLLAFISAFILYLVSIKFKVFEDPRIDEVQAILSGANCGGCGFAGCRNFAEALVASETFEGLNCPAGGAGIMNEVARILGREAPTLEPTVAVLACNGTRQSRQQTSVYNGVPDCRIAHNLFMGETGCSYGCLGKGDCVRACSFGAMYMDQASGLPVIIDDKCVSCKACIKACPRGLIELRKRAPKGRRIHVACSSRDKGGPARRACQAACIACNKCVNVCKFGAVKVENNLAYIDATKCTFCRKCAVECPTGAILEINFPPRKSKTEAKPETSEV